MGTIPVDIEMVMLQDLANLFGAQVTTRNIALVTAVICVYDHGEFSSFNTGCAVQNHLFAVTTFDEEVRQVSTISPFVLILASQKDLIWTTRNNWSMAKMLFLIVRYGITVTYPLSLFREYSSA